MSSGSKLLCFYSIKMNSLFMFFQEWCCFYVYCGIRGHFVRDLWIQSHKCDRRGFVLVRALEWVTLGWFFQITLLQAGIYARHTKEQEKYRSYMFYVSIFQRFWTFVLYNYILQLQGKDGQNKPENPQHWNMAKIYSIVMCQWVGWLPGKKIPKQIHMTHLGAKI